MQYRFSICCENKSSPGYCTEKIFMAFLAGAVPIYWGDPTIETDFNKNAFINLNGINSKDIVNKVMEIENDKNKWIKMASTSPLKEGVLEKYYKKLRSKFEIIIEKK
jgi:ribosomal protein S17E